MKTLKHAMFTAIMILLLAACGPAATAVPTPTPSPVPPAEVVDAQRTVTAGGAERTYFLHIPAGLQGGQPVPLVFFFHGYSESGRQSRSYTGFDKVADANGFVVVYPNGSGPSGSMSWNGSGCCGEALEENVDEPAFVRAILADVGTLLPVDAKRVYASGFSNGALLSYRLACEMSDTFAAVAPAGGVLMYSPCEPEQPVSLMHIHGLTDRVVPFDGGGSGIQFPPVRDSLAAWEKIDGCSGAEQVEEDGILTHTTFGSCAPGVSVELVTLSGTGHTWPSQYVVPVTKMVWEFFAAHPKP